MPESEEISASFLVDLVEKLPSMVAYWGCDLNCRYANRAYERWYGADPGGIVGRSIQDVFGPAQFALEEPLIRNAFNGHSQVFETTTPHAVDIRRHGLGVYSPDLVDGVVRGLVVQVTEVTPLKIIETELRSESARWKRSLEQSSIREDALRRAQRLGETGSWEWDLRTDVVTWSDELYRLFGCDPSAPPPPFIQHSKLVRSESWDKLKDAVNRTRTHGTPYCLELEFHRRDSTLGWLEVRGEAVADDRGVIIGLRGISQDVTHRRTRVPAAAELPKRSALIGRNPTLVRLSERIRTSLNHVLGSAHLLQRHIVPATSQARWLDQILQGGKEIEGALVELEQANPTDLP